MKFFSAVIRHVIYSLLLLLAVLVLNFLLIHLAPGDPVQTIVGEMGGATPEIIAQIRAEYGLDKSLPQQLFTYIRRAAGGNLGKSFHYNEPVTKLIFQRIGGTLLLTISALVIAVIVGTVLGVLSAQKPRGVLNQIVTVFSLIGYSAPVFWTGIMLLILLAYLFPIFPSFGMQTVGFRGSLWGHTWDILRHLVLPAFTLASVYLALFSRLSRASMLDVLVSDYIRTARAKGLSEGVVVYQHALKNALIPVVTMAGLQFSRVLAGAVVVETVFSWPGMGLLAFESILRRDHTLLLGILFFSTFIVVIINILTDLSYRLLDPRIK
jgi:peptide/nickel transport system permease protein